MSFKSLGKAVVMMILIGDFSTNAFEEPDWWPLIQSTFDGVNLRRCFKRNEFVKSSAPPNGEMCSELVKTCFFDDQVCNGKSYPQTRCFCDGLTWNCESVTCPDQVSFLALGETEVPLPAPTKAPVPAPTQSPVLAPTQAPDPMQATILAPTQAPVPVSNQAPIFASTQVSVPAPTQAPVPAPSQPLVPSPTQVPVRPLTQGPVLFVPVPTQSPIPAPTQASTQAPSQAAVLAPSQAPVPNPSKAPVTDVSVIPPLSATTRAPVTKAPVVPPALAPAESSTEDPAPNPSKAPVTDVSVKPPLPATTRAPVTKAPVVPPALAPALAPAESLTEAPVPNPSQAPVTDVSVIPPLTAMTRAPVTKAPVVPPALAPALSPVESSTEDPAPNPSKAPVTDVSVIPPLPATTRAPVTKAPVVPPALAPAESLTEDPVPNPSKAPVTDVSVIPPLPTTTRAPVTKAPVEAPALAPADSSTPTQVPTQGPGPAPADGSAQPTIPSCPSLEAIMADPNMPCVSGLGCFYNFIETRGDERCNVTKTCGCTSSQIDCTNEEVCALSPTCPVELEALRLDPSCSASGFGCNYEYSEEDGDQICVISEACTCRGTGAFECIVESRECKSAPVCPATIDVIEANPTCSSVGFTCFFSSLEPVGDELCVIFESCDCLDNFQYDCKSESTCVAGPKCPAEPTPKAFCNVEGFSCTYERVTPSIDGSQICTTIDTCVCNASNYKCNPTVICENVDVQDCPASKAVLDADSSCTIQGLGCGYTFVDEVGGLLCTSTSLCTCDGNGFNCVPEGDPDCVEGPTCPTFMAFQQDMSCSREGLGCTFTYSNNTDSDLCTVIETCECSAAGQFECSVEQSCMPAPTCPEFSVLQEDKTCDSADVRCIYSYANNTGSQTCAVNETCTCTQDNIFSCVIGVGTCTDNPPTLPPVSCPSFETFLEDPVNCPREGLRCTYASTVTASDGSTCERTDVCPCTASLQFDCNTTEVGDGCTPAPTV